MGLITFGVGVLLVAQIRTERQKLATVLEVMALGVAKATGGEPIVLDQAARADTPPDTLVVAGPSTFHRPDCRLIQGKPGLDRLTVEVARSSGLSPCRVCDPLGTSVGTTDGEVDKLESATGPSGGSDEGVTAP